MRIEIHSTNPTALLAKIRKDIIEHKIREWSLVVANKTTEFITHNREHWMNKAFLRPTIISDPARLVLTVSWWIDAVPTEHMKGWYVGRFTEELLGRYRSDFTKLETFHGNVKL